MKIEMPNGKTRIILSGVKRVRIHTYNKEDNIYEAIKEEIPNCKGVINLEI